MHRVFITVGQCQEKIFWHCVTTRCRVHGKMNSIVALSKSISVTVIALWSIAVSSYVFGNHMPETDIPQAPAAPFTNPPQQINSDSEQAAMHRSQNAGQQRKNAVFHHLTIDDGLSQSDVRAMVQDQQGFMWFGTWRGGLNRYDGYTFKVYKHDPQDEHSISSDNVWVLYADRSGTLWIGTIGSGLDQYDPATDTFVHYQIQPGDPTSLPNNGVRAIYEDESGSLWVGTFFTYRNNPDDPTSLS